MATKKLTATDVFKSIKALPIEERKRLAALPQAPHELEDGIACVMARLTDGAFHVLTDDERRAPIREHLASIDQSVKQGRRLFSSIIAQQRLLDKTLPAAVSHLKKVKSH